MKRPPSPTAAEVVSARRKAGLTQEQAADVVCLTSRQWQKYEKGTARMHPILFRYFCIIHNLIEVKP